MILVDTTVWIDFFAGRELPHVLKMRDLILDDASLAICGVILTEVLQGLPDDKTFARVEQSFRPLISLPMADVVFVRAATIYRGLRKKGVTIRKSNDCMIAATALQYDCELLHNDKDFTQISAVCPLRIA